MLSCMPGDVFSFFKLSLLSLGQRSVDILYIISNYARVLRLINSVHLTLCPKQTSFS